jgi:hypothetical protein
MWLLLACTQSPDDTAPPVAVADVLAVTGDERTLSVTIESPDTGCGQYADWWEVVSEQGELIYRRTLGHAHTDEQPFTRAGGPSGQPADQVVWIRAHMNPGGYGGQAAKGSAASGFTVSPLDAGFAADLATVDPQPEPCAF